MTKTKWKDLYLGEERESLIPIDTKRELKNIEYSYRLFRRFIKHKARMWYQKFFKKHHIKFLKHSRKTFRRRK